MCSKGRTVVEEVVLVGAGEHCDDKVVGLGQDDAATGATLVSIVSNHKSAQTLECLGYHLLKRFKQWVEHFLAAALVPLLRRG